MNQTLGASSREAPIEAQHRILDNITSQSHVTAFNDAFSLIGWVMVFIFIFFLIEAIWFWRTHSKEKQKPATL